MTALNTDVLIEPHDPPNPMSPQQASFSYNIFITAKSIGPYSHWSLLRTSVVTQWRL